MGKKRSQQMLRDTRFVGVKQWFVAFPQNHSGRDDDHAGEKKGSRKRFALKPSFRLLIPSSKLSEGTDYWL